MGLVHPSPTFLGELRRLTRHHGALLIYDEVMTGFRLAYGGAQELLLQEPDLTILGKIGGGGFPVGTWRPRGHHEAHHAGPVFQAGTLSGNPGAMAAGSATLTLPRETNPYSELDRLGKSLADGLRKVATEAGGAHTVNQVGSMWTLFFAVEPVTDYESAKKADTKKCSRFFCEMMAHGFYLPCSQFEVAFLSVLHTQERVNETIAAAREAIASVK
jgi:glutamate-1-semialdehyde 2,1-aminomutase